MFASLSLVVVSLSVARVVAAESDGSTARRHEAEQAHMGTAFRFVFYGDDDEVAGRALEAADRRIEALEQSMSDYRSDSEILLLCSKSGNDSAHPVSPDLFEVLARADRISRQTGGAFDVTVGPLTRLWRRARRRQQMPPEDRVRTARRSVGYRNLVIDTDGRTVRLTRPDMRVDLGGIAKGYAADEALRVLARHGITRCLVDAGGDLAVGEPPPGEEGWRVGIAPLRADKQPMCLATLARCGVATSGDAYQFVELDGRRYSHIIDPRSGEPTTRRTGATVIAPDCATADAYASALCVMDPEQGIAVIRRQKDVEAMVLSVDQSGERLVQSPGFPSAEETEP